MATGAGITSALSITSALDPPRTAVSPTAAAVSKSAASAQVTKRRAPLLELIRSIGRYADWRSSDRERSSSNSHSANRHTRPWKSSAAGFGRMEAIRSLSLENFRIPLGHELVQGCRLSRTARAALGDIVTHMAHCGN